MELNSAEAVMAALIILGEREQAETFIPRFNWAPEFMRLNGAMLDDYSKAADSAEVVRIQEEYIRSVVGEDSKRSIGRGFADHTNVFGSAPLGQAFPPGCETGIIFRFYS